MGVKRAIGMAQKASANENRTVYTYGPLIHNPQELQRLSEEGIRPLDDSGEPSGASVIIRAHGVAPGVLNELEARAAKVVDATCPKVSSIQERITDHSRDGYAVVIVGDPEHPEVVGLLGHAEGAAFVVREPEDIDALPELEEVLLVAQTTQDVLKYDEIKARFMARYPKGKALSTICSSTHTRQAEIRRMVGEVEAVVVIGGRNSANTKRLHAICLEAGLPAYHVESPDELPTDALRGLKVVGVTAGASTPQWIIDDVVNALEIL